MFSGFADQILDISQPHFIIFIIEQNTKHIISNYQISVNKSRIYQFLQYSIIIKSNNFYQSPMRNFNKDEIQKYEKITRNALSKVPRLSKLSQSISMIRFKHILFTFIISGLSYMAYRIQDYKKYRSQHYVNIFQWKSNISTSIRRKDLLEKITNLSLTKNSKAATDNYQKVLSQEFDRFVSRIKQKRTDEQTHDNQQKKEKKERERVKRKNMLEIVLSRSFKSKLDLGYFFKLHTKQHMTTITNKGELIKKTYIIPLMVFDVPFFVNKKQQVTRIKKNSKYSKVIQQKSKFQLSSECEKINYWNILFMKNQVAEQKKPEVNENEANIEDIQKIEKKNIEKMLNSNRNKKQLLFECRNQIKLREQKLLDELKNLVTEHWQKKSKVDTQDPFSFSIKTWDQQIKK